MRLLTEAEVFLNLPVCFALALHQTGGSTSMTVDTLLRFREAGALIMPVLADDVAEAGDLPDWVPLGIGAPFIPRAFIICLILNQKSYEAARSGARLDELHPWRPGDGQAYALINNVISVVRNGVARLVVALSERSERHPCFPFLKEVMWYTLTVKGVALTEFFGGQDTGRTLTRTFANGNSKQMPIFTLTAEDWHQHVNRVIARLLDIEANFSDSLSTVHRRLKEQ